MKKMKYHFKLVSGQSNKCLVSQQEPHDEYKYCAINSGYDGECKCSYHIHD